MIAPNVRLGDGVVIHHPDLVNLYGCAIGAGTRIGTFVEIQKERLDRRKLQDLQPFVHLRGRHDRGGCLRRPRRDVHQ